MFSLVANAVNSAVDPVVDGLVVVDEVHLVDREDDVGHPQQREDDGVPAGLLGEALPGVDQHQAEVGRWRRR